MKHLTRMLLILAVLIAAVAPLPGVAADDAIETHYVKYSVSEHSVKVVSAVTPYDSNQKVRDAFLHWFKRGFDTVLTGSAPLMVEWADSPEGKASQRGYDFGMDEAERYLKKKEPNQSLQTTSIPAG